MFQIFVLNLLVFNFTFLKATLRVEKKVLLLRVESGCFSHRINDFLKVGQNQTEQGRRGGAGQGLRQVLGLAGQGLHQVLGSDGQGLHKVLGSAGKDFVRY